MASILVSLCLAVLAAKKGRTAPTSDSADVGISSRQCIQLEIPVKVDVTATKWLQPRVESTIDTVEWVSELSTWSSPTQRDIGDLVVNDTFKISGQLCIPSGGGARSDVLQIVTHGAGFDSRYWDVRIKPSTYSYLDAALAEGYSVFTYDRLGTGKSQKPNGYDAVQVAPQVEILRQLTLLARAGKLVTSSVSKPPGNSPSTKTFAAYKPKKIVHVGHSLGSITTIGLLNTDNGTLSDGAILTGFIYSNKGLGAGQLIPGWGFEYAKENDPVKFGDRSGGYIVQARPGNVQLQFVKKGTFEPALLDYAWQIRQPATVSEFLSISQVLGKKAAGFKGAVQFVFGQNDLGFCGGNCTGTYDANAIRSNFYPAASAFDLHEVPGTGHGLTLSTTAPSGYKASFDFLHKSGL